MRRKLAILAIAILSSITALTVTAKIAFAYGQPTLPCNGVLAVESAKPWTAHFGSIVFNGYVYQNIYAENTGPYNVTICVGSQMLFEVTSGNAVFDVSGNDDSASMLDSSYEPWNRDVSNYPPLPSNDPPSAYREYFPTADIDMNNACGVTFEMIDTPSHVLIKDTSGTIWDVTSYMPKWIGPLFGTTCEQ